MLNLDEVTIDPACALMLPGSIALRRQVLPFVKLDGTVYVACADPEDASALRAVERALELPIQAECAEPESLRRALRRVYGTGSGLVRTLGAVADAADEFVRLSDELLNAAIVRNASDIHLEPEEDRIFIRLRVDGMLEPYKELPASALSGLVSRFKVMSGMDIAEKRLPQDGQIRYTSVLTGKTLGIRVATIPTTHGEKVTLRLLGLQAEALTLESLGMRPDDREAFLQALNQPNGMVLLTGPTGSGKTSTFYSALRRIQEHGKSSIITIEDPVEFDLRGIPQVEVDQDRFTYARALRSVLRHDPDVIMVGEIRDEETAEIAVRAAITGHLVLSTLHTRSAPNAITRLVDIGVEPFLVAATIRLVVAQRLVRRLCSHCREPRSIEPREALLLGDPSLAGQQAFRGTGCKYCGGRGMAGRQGIFEVLAIDDDLGRSIAAGVSEGTILAELRQRGHRSLSADGRDKVLNGITTVEEVIRVAGGEG